MFIVAVAVYVPKYIFGQHLYKQANVGTVKWKLCRIPAQAKGKKPPSRSDTPMASAGSRQVAPSKYDDLWKRKLVGGNNDGETSSGDSADNDWVPLYKQANVGTIKWKSYPHSKVQDLKINTVFIAACLFIFPNMCIKWISILCQITSLYDEAVNKLCEDRTWKDAHPAFT